MDLEHSNLQTCSLSVKHVGDVTLFVCDQDEDDAQEELNNRVTFMKELRKN